MSIMHDQGSFRDPAGYVARLFVVSHAGDMTDVHEYKRDF